MTPAELRGLLARATPGPWGDAGVTVTANENYQCGSGPWLLKDPEQAEHDSRLIAALRNEAPALLDRVEALEQYAVKAAEKAARIASVVDSGPTGGPDDPVANARWIEAAARALLRDGEGR